MDIEAVSFFAGANLNVLLAVAAVRSTHNHHSSISDVYVKDHLIVDAFATDGIFSQNVHV